MGEKYEWFVRMMIANATEWQIKDNSSNSFEFDEIDLSLDPFSTK